MTSAQRQLIGLPASELATLIRTRQVSPVELTRACLARIKAVNPRVNAFITVTAERAERDAQLAEQAVMQGGYRGPLHGIPYAPKDILATVGVRTTNGSRVTASWTPMVESTITERLARAGAVLVGKLNLLEFAMGSGVASGFGPARNPWDLSRTPSGSSSGSGVALAADMVPVSIGTDTGGSIRGAGRVLWGRRPQADLRTRQPVRGHDPGLDAGPCRAHDPNGSRRRDGAAGHRGRRPA